MVARSPTGVLFGLLFLCFGSPTIAKVNYAEVRQRVNNAYQEKVHEMQAMLSSLQQASKESASNLAAIEERCGSAAAQAASSRP